MAPPQSFVIPYNIAETITVLAETILPDGTIEYLVRTGSQDRTLKGTRAIFDAFSQAKIAPGTTAEVMKVSSLDVEGRFVSRIVVHKIAEAPQV